MKTGNIVPRVRIEPTSLAITPHRLPDVTTVPTILTFLFLMFVSLSTAHLCISPAVSFVRQPQIFASSFQRP